MINISIVIVSWNARKHLLDCLQSIRDTTGALNVETIVVDNHSSDGSPDAVEDRFPETILVRNQTNAGFAKANNIGLAKSAGRYVALVNSDVLILEHCLQNLTTFMDTHPSVGMAGPRILNADRTLQPSGRRFPSLLAAFARAFFLDRLLPQRVFHLRSRMSPAELGRLRSVNVLVGCFWMVRREALEQVGGLDEDFFIYGEDNDWCRRFHRAGWQVMYYPGAEAIHFGGASSSNAPARFFIEMKKSELLYWDKNYGRLARHLACGISLAHIGVRLVIWKIQYYLRPARREKCVPMIERYSKCLRWLLGRGVDHSTS